MNMTATEARQQTCIRRFWAVVMLASLIALGTFVYQNATTDGARFPFRLGLDLAGGSHLVYEADVSKVAPEEVPELMNVLRDVIERRVNAFGVAEPIVQVEESSFVSDVKQHRLVVELPGVTDVAVAVAEIGKTPLLEFKLIDETALQAQIVLGTTTASTSIDAAAMTDPFVDTGLTGRYLTSAALEFAGGQPGQLANEPIVSIVFSAEGAELFERITREHTGERLAIFLDGEMLSAPNINEPIMGGKAIISGGFTPDEARALAQNLNFGALPVPITLASTQTIDATLGASVVEQSIMAGAVGLLVISLFMMFWYRVPGVIASIALAMYIVINCAIFMLIPVTLTAAGLAGFVLSLGMAVDANVLVFERLKEEFRSGKGSRAAAQEGFARAWSAIRDGNVTSLLSAIILFWFGTSMIKGFALVLGIGIIISMLSALTLTRVMLLSLPDVKKTDGGVWPFLFGTGLKK
jgi:preprotein translocase subunit SecD